MTNKTISKLLVITLFSIVTSCNFSNKFVIRKNTIKNQKNLICENYETALAILQPNSYKQNSEIDSLDKWEFINLINAIKNQNLTEANEIAKKTKMIKSDTLFNIKNSIIQTLGVYSYLVSLKRKYNETMTLPNIVQTDTNYIELPFKFINNRIYLTIIIDGIEFNMFLDSGYPNTILTKCYTLLDKRKVYTINTNNSIIDASGITKMQTDEKYIKTEYLLGNLQVEGHVVEVNEVSESDKLKYDGVIGWDIISQLDMVFNFKTNTLNLRKSMIKHFSKKCNMFWCLIPMIETYDCDGFVMTIGIDFGCNVTTLSKWYFDKRGVVPNIIKSRVGETLSRFGSGSNKYFMSDNICININSNDFMFENIIFQERFPFMNNITIDGLIGTDLFQNNILHFDYQNSIFEINPN
ncbi:MAG: hypothetical protein NTW25_07435 [Candidatus Kapabacteria bacterium]|nr:hypothetical protein [Candidatus Kapabacteria bacterium]